MTVAAVKEHLELQSDEINGRRCRRRPKAPPYSTEMAEFITSHRTLNDWATFPIVQRVQILRRLYPERPHTAYGLRKLYQQSKVKIRPIGLNCELTDKQKAHIVQRKLSVLPLVIDIVD